MNRLPIETTKASVTKRREHRGMAQYCPRIAYKADPLRLPRSAAPFRSPAYTIFASPLLKSVVTQV
jgi:hypothetical protein